MTDSGAEDVWNRNYTNSTNHVKINKIQEAQVLRLRFISTGLMGGPIDFKWPAKNVKKMYSSPPGFHRSNAMQNAKMLFLMLHSWSALHNFSTFINIIY